MQARDLTRPDSFLTVASPLLLQDEPRHNLILGICGTLIDTPDAYPVFHAWTIEHDGEVLAAAAMTPPFNLVVSKPRTPAALRFLAEELHQRQMVLPGVTGARPEVDSFATAWEELTRLRPRRRMRQGIYQASSGRPPDGVPGGMRPATKDDRQLVLEWLHAFEDECLPADVPRGRTETNIDRRLASATSGIALWEDDNPVSCAGYGGRTPHGVRIGPVYTPPNLRRRGYATALVAHLTQRLLDEASRFCFLYTDLANPTSNRIYQSVGYQFVAESVDYAFDPA